MKSLRHKLLFEANKKSPSGIGKIKNTSREEDVEFIAGDIYDLSGNNRYTDKFTYYSGKGDGYIMDKDGNYYDVVTSSWSSDAGRIAGGSMNYQVIIKKANGTNDAIFSGYSAIFSTPHYDWIISDIKAGYYLEDYIAKNWGALNNQDDFKELKEKGDPKAKSHSEEKKDDEAKKLAEFNERYIILPKFISFYIDNDKLKFEGFRPKGETEGKPEKGKYSLYERDFPSREAYLAAEEALKKQWKEYEDKLEEVNDKLVGVVKNIATQLTEEYFKAPLSKLNGLHFGITPKGNNQDTVSIAIDTKKNKVVTLNRKKKYDRNSLSAKYGPWKDINENPTFVLASFAKVWKNKVSDYLADIFKRASEAWKKVNSRTKTKYIEDNWEEIWQSGRGHYWAKDKYTKKEAKEIAERNFYKWIEDFDWNSYSKQNIEFSTDFIKDFIKGDLPVENTKEETKEEPKEEQTTKETSKETKVDISKARKVQEPKMDAWHNGTRKQNVSSCSDAKLKLNYEICKDKGYDAEAAILKKEADARGLKLESLNLEEMKFSTIERLDFC